MPLSWTDLFVVGLALDITGAVLLAMGLLVSPRTIAVLSSSYYDINATDAINRVENKVDAEFGVAALGLGFLLQAIGYLAVLLGAESSTGLSEGLVGIALGLVLAGAVSLAHRLVKPKRALAMLPDVALEHGKQERGVWTPQRADVLVACGLELGHPRREGEGRVAYARHVFDVELPPECD